MIKFSFNFYDGDAAAAPYRQFAELDDTAAPTSTGQLFAMGLNNNLTGNKYMARILGFDGGAGVSAFFKLDDVGSPIRSTGWHSLEADISDNAVVYYVDGILSKTVNTTALTDRSLDTIRLGSAVTSTTVAYYDDLRVERLVVPEPSSVALGLLGGLAFAVVKRRKN